MPSIQAVISPCAYDFSIFESFPERPQVEEMEELTQIRHT
jgi:hypothetical protein